VLTGILLAAGRAQRFGSQKLLARLPDGRRVIEASAANLLAAMGRVIAVTGRDERLMRVLDDCGCQLVLNERALEGMGTSIAAGVRATAADSGEGWLVALGDMPYIKPATIRQVGERLLRVGGIVIPACQQQRGHPVGFGREHLNALSALEGDSGARTVIAQALGETPARVQLLEVEDAGVLADIDTPADLR
jgi:molybdenum cofactor cytidylyltransferase